MVARKSFGPSWAAAVFLSLLTLLFTLLVLLSGVGGHTSASYLTVDTRELSIPAKLAGSAFLKDLSMVSGGDLIGQSKTRENLGLSTTYHVSLLTACGRNNDDSTSCYSPQVGFTFTPGRYLKIDRTSAQSSLATSYYSKLDTYAAVSMFVAVAYILASLLTVVSCASIVLSRRFARAALISYASIGVAALLLFAATVASIVTFIKMRDAFNSALGDLGVTTSTNASAFGLSAAATITSIATLVAAFVTRPSAASPYPREKRNAAGADEAGYLSRDAQGAKSGGGFLNRVATWNRPRYAPIEETKLTNVYSRDQSRDRSPDSDRENLMNPAGDAGTHGPAGDSHYSQTQWAAAQQSRPNLDYVQTAYEPSPRR
ncbi:SUR7/PalI family-domain-containing protein [Astrocystis sublimbata]|nr:SUR7/PalI family-domain-containing protein [Astrocystis sublimbata]